MLPDGPGMAHMAQRKARDMTVRNRIHQPTYLVHLPHSYCFRLVVPPRYRPAIGLRELKFSLNTGALSKAKFRAKSIAAYVHHLFKQLDAGASQVQTLAPEQLQGLIRDFVADMLATWESHTLSRPVSDDVWLSDLDQLQMTKAEEIEELARRDFSRVSHIADRVLDAAGLPLDRTSNDYRKLCVELLKASVLLSDVWIARHQGDYGRTNAQVIAEAVSKVDAPNSGTLVMPQLQVPTSPPPAAEKNLLTKVISEYATEKKNAGKWTPKTEQENHACYRLFLSWAGEGVMVEDITAKLMREYKAALQKLPANMEKSPQYRGKSIKELLQMADQSQIPSVMGIATINKNLNRVSTVLGYAVKNGYIPFNPAADMQVEQPKRDEELRDTFSQEDLHALFHSPQYTHDTFKHPYQFWTPLLALFTAARQNELAQLYLDDLRQEDGVWVFDIQGKRPDQRLKNKNAARLIPIHPFLLELGLVRYAQVLRDMGESRLFPELTLRRDGYGQDVSRWFNGNGISQGYRQRCGVEADPGQGRKDFHSFRHTTITYLVGKRVDMNLLHKLDGHKLDSMTLDRYGKGWSLVHAMKAEVIDLLEYHQTIPLDHLKASKFART